MSCFFLSLTFKLFPDGVGCFQKSSVRLPLQKLPESPAVLDTKFYLFRRDIKFSNPEILYYDDAGKSLEISRFNYSQPIKLIIHGFLSKWRERGALIATHTYLKMVCGWIRYTLCFYKYTFFI